MTVRSRFRSLTAIIRNLLLDMRYGGSLAGSIPSQDSDKGAYDVANVQYSVLPLIFSDRVGPSDVVVDVGCGKGRVINWLLSRGIRNRIVGIELNSEVAMATNKRLARYRNVQIIAGDAIDNLPADGTIFFLFNPFNATVMERFKERLRTLFGDRGGITVLYYAAVHLEVFRNDPHWVLEEHELGEDHDARFRQRHRKYAVLTLRGPGSVC